MKKFSVIIILAVLLSPAVVFAGAIRYDYPDFKTLIGRNDAAAGAVLSKPIIGITSHHLPTASPLIDNFYASLAKARPAIKTFVIIGPDHFEKCRWKLVTDNFVINTMFGELAVDNGLYARLKQSGVRQERGCFTGEHSIGVQANYIKKFFPEAKVVPVLFSYSAKNRNFSRIIKILKKDKADIFVLASLDFAHYVDVKRAAASDELSLKKIRQLASDSFSLRQVDSPGTMKLILRLAKELNLKPRILEHKNSADFGGAYTNTTSYFSVFFE